MPQNIYMRPCKCIWQILRWLCVNIFKLIIWQQYMCKCKKFGHVNINDLHLHKIYTLYIRLLTLTLIRGVWYSSCGELVGDGHDFWCHDEGWDSSWGKVQNILIPPKTLELNTEMFSGWQFIVNVLWSLYPPQTGENWLQKSHLEIGR